MNFIRIYNKEVSHYGDGACWQAQAVMAYLSQTLTIESSWDDKRLAYKAVPCYSRWENCREQGYVVSLANEKNEQLNVVFYEHRNTDEICIMHWIQNTINAPTLSTLPEGVFVSKYDYQKSFPCGDIVKAGDYIRNLFNEHWKSK